MSLIETAFIDSCRDEIEAPKPGNVHVFAEGHGMTVNDFLRSAEAAAPALCNPRNSVGARIQGAVEATWEAVGKNTNLGIILLCAPLAVAAEDGEYLREALERTLGQLTKEDAKLCFDAIRRASPAGLGAARRHDVFGPVEATLLEAMREAAERDRVAFQYASGFVDIFETGLPALAAARAAGSAPPWTAIAAYLAFLAEFPDSHIARKHGPAAARQVRDEAAPLRQTFVAAPHPERFLPELLRFDLRLKTLGFNPGASADLTVASLFADRLTRILIKRRNNG